MPVWNYMHLYFIVLDDTAWCCAGPIAGYGSRTWDDVGLVVAGEEGTSTCICLLVFDMFY